MNPVDDKTFTGPLITALRGHIDAIQDSIASPDIDLIAHEAARPAAVAWVYYTALVAWAEDHELVDPWLRKGADDRDTAFQAGLTPTGYLATAFAALAVHPATMCLLDPRYSELTAGTPGEVEAKALLDWWAAEAPSLKYDVDTGPGSITGWLPGDLLQALSAERVKKGAFCQTPWWVADFIIDRTLVPACGEFRDEPVLRTIDPTCGTGHLLSRKIDYLWEWYTTGTLAPRRATGGSHATGGSVLEPVEAIDRIIAGVHGCERDPLTAAVARLRFVVQVGELMHKSGIIPTLRLDQIPHFHPVIAVGDSLLAGVISESEYAALHPELADIQNLGYPDEKESRRSPTGRGARLKSESSAGSSPADGTQPTLFDDLEAA